MRLLELDDLLKHFFGVTAVDSVGMGIDQGTITGLIGPNGSGKTTLFNCITGQLAPDSGKVYFRGKNITDFPPHKVSMLGIARTFQKVRVFQELSVRENLVVSCQQHQEDNILGRILHFPNIVGYEKTAEENALDAADFVGLKHLYNEYAGNLSYGQRKLLAFASCLVFEPEIILLDEPTAAVNPTMITRMKKQVFELNQEGLTFFIVEHNMDFIMDISEKIIVLDHGKKIAEGTPKEIRANEMVLEAYFGR